MSLNFKQISTDLYQKIKVRFPSVQIGSAEGKITSEPNLARFFDFDFESNGQVLGRVSIALTEKNGMMVLHSANIVSNQSDNIKNNWFDFLKELRQFAKKRLLNFDIRDISKSNLDKRDFQYIAKNNIGEPKMSESKLFGTSKTSYQELGEVKLIVKHSQPVNLNSVNGRTQHIHSIHLENSQGERFKYPYKHLAGARALASHVAEGGTPYDPIGKHVISLSEELNKLRQYKNYVFRNPMMIEAMGELTEKANYRIAEIKKQLEGLQRPTYYKDFKESFNISELKEVPEEVINDWTERLTIRKFKEDLASVFPYLYRLSETTIEPTEVQELSYDDFTQEDVESDELEYTKEDSYWGSFEESLSEVRPEFEQVEEGHSPEVEEFFQKIANGSDEGYDMLYDAHSGKFGRDIMRAVDDMYQDIVIDTGYHADDDFEDIYSRMMDNIEADYADKDVNEGQTDVDYELHQIARSDDEEELIDAMEGLKGAELQIALEDMMSELKDELAAKGMNDVMRDEDKMIEMLMDKVIEEYGEDGEEYDDGDMDGSDADDHAMKSAGLGSNEEYDYDPMDEQQYKFQRVKFRGTDHDIGEERYVFAVDGNLIVFNFSSDEDNPDPDSPSFEEILAKVQRDGEVGYFKVSPAEQKAIAKKIAAERRKHLDQRNKDDLPFDPDPEGGPPSDKDEFGNTIKHRARHLARMGMNAIINRNENTATEGNEFAAKVQKLKAMGAKPGTKFKTSDGEEHTLKDAIQRAGLQLEDFYDVSEIMMSEEDEVRDYVKSHFDYTTNRFPRGETSVLTGVSKKFGEEAISLAQEAIRELQTNEDPEIARIRKLSGL